MKIQAQNKIVKRKREKSEAMIIMLKELKSMFPTFIICNAVAIVGCVIYSMATDLYDWRILTGLLLGNAAALGNFYLLGVKASKVVKSKDIRKAQTYSTTLFLVKYFGAFALFGALVTFELINLITAVIPLFYPKIHYTMKAILNKEV